VIDEKAESFGSKVIFPRKLKVEASSKPFAVKDLPAYDLSGIIRRSA